MQKGQQPIFVFSPSTAYCIMHEIIRDQNILDYLEKYFHNQF
jgi:hypothetical protein